MALFLAAAPWVIRGAIWGVRAIQASRAASAATAAARAAQAAAASQRAQQTAAAVARAAAGAQALSRTKAREEPCDDCENPCAHLACGVPGSTYRGGAHGCVGSPANKTPADGSIHSHHMPADRCSPLARPLGPAIQMKKEDHYSTASYGSRVHGPTYATQRALLQQGKVYAAFRLDVADARRIAAQQGDPTRYEGAIQQATAYADCLKKQGLIR